MRHPAFFAFLVVPLFFAPEALQGQQSMSFSADSHSAKFDARLRLRSDPPLIGQPVSYEQVDENSRELADGTHITRKSVRTFYRDSQGRTRTERPLFGAAALGGSFAKLKFIEIHDPVAGLQYVLDTQHRVAYRAPLSVIPPSPTADATATVPSKPAFSALSSSPRPEQTNESLGGQIMEGVSVQGTRSTTVYPVGSMDNDRPITRTCETWYSSELAIAVVYKCSDLLKGDSDYRDTNISRSEPDASLFQVPSGYSIVDSSKDGRIEMNFQRPGD